MIRAVSNFPSGAQPGQYPSAVVGDAVLNADGSVTGTDNAAAHRADWLTAKALGLKLYIPPGNYIWQSRVVQTGEAFDNCGIVGEPGRTRIYAKLRGQSNSYQLLVFDGVLAVDGITTTPTYYLTAAAAISAKVLSVNTSVGMTPGMPIMLVDMGNPVLQYLTDDPDADGSPVTKYGQVTKVIATDNAPVATYTIASSVLDVSEGQVTITLTSNANFGSNQIIKLSGLTGTGVYADFEGTTQLSAVPTGGTTVTIAVPFDQEAFTFTGGTLTFGSLTPNTIMIGPQAESALSGTPTVIETHTISSGPYDPLTGLIVLTLATPHAIATNQSVVLSALTGTGGFAAFNGIQLVTSVTSTTVLTLKAAIGLPAASIAGGTLTYGSPLTTSTVIRRFTSAPKNVTTSGLIFDYDRLDINSPTQVRILLRALESPEVADCEFWGPGTGVAIDNGTHNFVVRDSRASELGPSSYFMTLSSAYMGSVRDVRADSGRHVINTTAAMTTCAAAQIDVYDSKAWDFWYTPWTDHPGVRGLRFHNCGAVGGRTAQASGFQLRGLDEELNDCWSTGFEFGFTIAFADGAKVNGGSFNNNRFGGRVIHSRNTRINGATFKGNSQASFLFDNVADVSPYDKPFAGLELINVKVDGVPAIADILYELRSPNFPPVFHDNWRVSDVTAFGRTVKYVVGQGKLYTPSKYPFPGRFAYGLETMYAAFNVTPGLPALYKLDSVLAVVPATLPTTGRVYGVRYGFKAAKPAGNAITIVGVVDGTTDPTMSDLQTKWVIDRQQQFSVAATGSTYITGSGVTELVTTEAIPYGQGVTVTVSGLTGTSSLGSVSTLNGTYSPTLLNTKEKTTRFVGATGLGVVVITGGTISFGGYEETT